MKIATVVLWITGTVLIQAQDQQQQPTQDSAPLVHSWKVGDSIGTITATDGKTYVGAKLANVEPDGISILYADGGAKIPFANLSPEFQRQFGYSRDKAAFYAREQQYLAKIDQLEEENARLRMRLKMAVENTQAPVSLKNGFVFFFNSLSKQCKWSSSTHAAAKALSGPFAGMTWGQAQVKAQETWETMSDQDKVAFAQKAETYGPGTDPSVSDAKPNEVAEQHHGARMQAVYNADGTTSQQVIVDP